MVPTIRKPNSYLLIQAANRLGIGVEIIDKDLLKLKLSYNKISHVTTKVSFAINDSQAINFTHNKHLTNQLLRKNNINTPKEFLITSTKDISDIKLPPFPLVVKPLDGQKGASVYVGINNLASLTELTKSLLKKHRSLLIQNQAIGTDYRFTVLNGQIIGISARHPQAIVGDGQRTIQQLIDHHNHTLRYLNKTRDYHLQNGIKQNDTLTWHIQNQGKTPNSVLSKQDIFTPLPIANFQTGGWVETINPSCFNPEITKTILKIAKLAKLTISGIDAIIKDPSSPTTNNFTFIEINSDPSLRLHDRPNKGENQHTNEALLRYIFSIN